MPDVVYQDNFTRTSGPRIINAWWNGVKSPYPTNGSADAVFSQIYRKGVRRVKPKQLDDTPYELYIRQLRGPKGKCTKTDGPSYQEHEGILNEWLSAGPSRYHETGRLHSTDLADVAKLNALAKLNRKDLDLGTAWKERGKTMQLVGDLAISSVELIQALRSKNPNRVRDVLSGTDNPFASGNLMQGGRNVVDGYLGYHYGVKPALQEVAGGVQALTRMDPEAWRISTVGKAGRDLRKKWSGMIGQSPLAVATNLREGAKFHVSAIRRETSRADDIRWALGLDDPLSTVWETTPFSFVFDWLVPVGDWLAALNGSKYYTNWRCSLSQYRKEVSEGGNTALKVGSAWYDTKLSDAGSYMTVFVKRTVTSTLPITGLPVKNPFSANHMAKGLSLLASTLARGGEPPRFIRY